MNHISRREMVKRVLIITGSVPATASILLAAAAAAAERLWHMTFPTQPAKRLKGIRLVATDADFTAIVQSGTADAGPMWAHSLHIDVSGLEPDTWYWYRFTVGGFTSPVGRTRTTPALDAKPERLRFATACCQDYTDGYYTPYQALVQEDLDLVLFLGDYIYEDAGAGVRDHGGVGVGVDNEQRSPPIR